MDRSNPRAEKDGIEDVANFSQPHGRFLAVRWTPEPQGSATTQARKRNGQLWYDMAQCGVM